MKKEPPDNAKKNEAEENQPAEEEPQHEYVSLIIENIMGHTRLRMEVRDDTTVEELKRLALRRSKGSPSSQCLIYNDAVLKDEGTVKSYNLRDKTVFMVPYMKSGPRRQPQPIPDVSQMQSAIDKYGNEAVSILKRLEAAEEMNDDDVLVFRTGPDGKLQLVRVEKSKPAAKKDVRTEQEKKVDEEKERLENERTRVKMKNIMNRIQVKKQKTMEKWAPKTPSSADSITSPSAKSSKLAGPGDQKSTDASPFRVSRIMPQDYIPPDEDVAQTTDIDTSEDDAPRNGQRKNTKR